MSKTDKFARAIIIITILLLFLIAILTKYNGSIDTSDYTTTAKFFSGDHQAKLRASHSIVYGLMHTPFVKLTSSFLFLKLSSVLWLALLILSIYYISNKNKKTLLLFITTPIIWYMAPYINPIQLSSLLFLWGYYFIKKYDENEKLKYLICSALLIGLSWAFWDSIIYFTIILALCFLYNKKTTHFFSFIFFLFIGTLPKLIIDQFFFGFAFFSISKHFLALMSWPFGGVYGQGSFFYLTDIFFAILIIPLFTYLLFTKKIFTRNKKSIVFIGLSIFLILIHCAQIRYTLIIIPIIILLLGENLNNRQFKIQILIFLILSLLVINPYLIQTKYETNGKEFTSFIKNLPNLQLSKSSQEDLILQDLNNIIKENPNQTFIVGNEPNDFQYLANLYWGKEVKEFISIEDYNLYLKNETTIASKTLCSSSKSWNRRDICVMVELRKTIDDKTNYSLINYAISFEEDLDLRGFKLVEKYQVLYLFKKEINKIKHKENK